MLRPALFFDRDGIINADTGYVHTREQFVFMPGIFSLVRAARAGGHLVVVVTNQAGIGRGYYSEAQFHELMDWVKAHFREQGGDLDAVYFCPDHLAHGIGRYRRDSAQRKPGPGMLLQAEQEHGIDLARSAMVGDSPKDMEAGRAAGIGTLLYVGGESGGGVQGCGPRRRRGRSVPISDQSRGGRRHAEESYPEGRHGLPRGGGPR